MDVFLELIQPTFKRPFRLGINNHLHIGDGAQVTAMSGVKDDIPPNGRWGGFFAKPTKQWYRELFAVERLARNGAPNAGSAKAAPKDRITE